MQRSIKLLGITFLITVWSVEIWFAGTLQAEETNWPQRRGVDWNAISETTDKLEPWEPSNPPVVWMRSLGQSYSGFTAAEGRLFTQTQTLTRQTVECLDPRTGRTIWQYAYAWPFDPAGLYPGPRATPTWHAGKVYFVSPDLLVGCVDARSGKLLWQRDLGKEYRSRGTDFGYACSPTIVDGRLILPVGAKEAGIIALDPEDGSTIWTTSNRQASYASVIPVMLGEHRLAVALMRNYAILLDVATGKVLWEKQLSSGYDEHSAAPLWEVIDDTAYLVIAQPFQAGAMCFTVKRHGEPPEVEVESAWTKNDFSNDTASSVLYQGHVYGFDLQDVQAKKQRPSEGKFKCLDVTDGSVCWESDKPGHATVVITDGKLLMLNDRGEFIMARATPEKYEELARAEIFPGEVCWTAPMICDGRVYLRSPTKAACLALRREANESFDYQPPSPLWAKLFDLRGWVAGERPYMMDSPDLPELWRWYAFSIIGIFLPASVIGLLVAWFSPRYGTMVFWLAAFLLGVLGTGIFNRLFGPFVLTWPVCLAMAHQRALNLGVLRNPFRHENISGDDKLPGVWAARRAIVFLLVVCWLYYSVCARLGMALEWAFLIGFLPSWILALPVAYFLNPKRPPVVKGARAVLIDALGYTLSFSAFFWAVGLYYLLR